MSCFSISYSAHSWTFCHAYDSGTLQITKDSDVNVFRNYEEIDIELTYDYCEAYWSRVEKISGGDNCILINSEIDCSKNDKFLRDFGCYDFTNTYFKMPFDAADKSAGEKVMKVRLGFPQDDTPKVIEDYGPCENADFFKNFNGRMDIAEIMQVLVIYAPKFDLSTLNNRTSSRTKHVIIQADLVYMTKDLKIDYNLTIKSRVVSISHTISMIYDAREVNIENMKLKEVNEFHVERNNDTIERHRSFGLVYVIDTLKSQKPFTALTGK